MIIRIIEFNNDKNECNKLGKALEIIDAEIERINNEVPSTSELESRKIDYDIFRYQLDNYK